MMKLDDKLIQEIKEYCDIYNNELELQNKLKNIISESIVDIIGYTGLLDKNLDFSSSENIKYKSLLKNLVRYIWNGYSKKEFINNNFDDINYLKRKNEVDYAEKQTKSL